MRSVCLVDSFLLIESYCLLFFLPHLLRFLSISSTPQGTIIMRLPSFTGLAVLGAATAVKAISTISTYGNKFFLEDGSQFFIKGVAYQLTSDDPLIDATQCALDAKLMKELGANAIRVYHVDSSVKHTDCMSAFADAGIYLFVDLDTFDSYILPVRPAPAYRSAHA